MARSQQLRSRHVFRIESWKLDFFFGIDELPKSTGLYHDVRHLTLIGKVIEPSNIIAKTGEIVLFPQTGLNEAEKTSRRRFGERLGVPQEARPEPSIGSVHYRGSDYGARLNFPYDALAMILQMLTANKYRHIIFDAAKGGRDAAVFNFMFTGDRDGDLAASWDDA